MKIHFRALLYCSLLFSSLLLHCKETYANEKKNITGINLGVYEKGPYIGIYSDIDKKNQVEVGINYLDLPVGNYDANFSENIESRLSFAGLRLLYRRFYKPNTEPAFAIRKYPLNFSEKEPITNRPKELVND